MEIFVFGGHIMHMWERYGRAFNDKNILVKEVIYLITTRATHRDVIEDAFQCITVDFIIHRDHCFIHSYATNL